MDFNKLFRSSYLFDPSPDALSAYFWIFTGFFAITVIGSMVYKKRLTGITKKLCKNHPTILFWLGSIGLLVEFFRYEHVPYLSMRIITYVLVISILVIIGRNIYMICTVYPKEQAARNAQAEINKYLPRKKS